MTFSAFLWFITLIGEMVGSSGVTTKMRGKEVEREGFSYLPSRTSSSRWRPADTDPAAPEWWSHRTAARWHAPSEEQSVSRKMWGKILLLLIQNDCGALRISNDLEPLGVAESSQVLQAFLLIQQIRRIHLSFVCRRKQYRQSYHNKRCFNCGCTHTGNTVEEWRENLSHGTRDVFRKTPWLGFNEHIHHGNDVITMAKKKNQVFWVLSVISLFLFTGK